jgi:hypothetical protein
VRDGNLVSPVWLVHHLLEAIFADCVNRNHVFGSDSLGLLYGMFFCRVLHLKTHHQPMRVSRRRLVVAEGLGCCWVLFFTIQSS